MYASVHFIIYSYEPEKYLTRIPTFSNLLGEVVVLMARTWLYEGYSGHTPRPCLGTHSGMGTVIIDIQI